MISTNVVKATVPNVVYTGGRGEVEEYGDYS
jgi:hypothetical protein